MKKHQIIAAGWLVLSVLYHFLFWQEKMGINIGIYQLFTTVFLVKLYPTSFRSRATLVATVFTWLATMMIIWHNSFISKFAYFASFGVMIGFVHQPRLQTVLYGFLHSFHALVISLAEGIQSIIKLPKTFKLLGKTGVLINRQGKLIVIPTLIFFVFFGIFKAANPVFDRLTNQGFEHLAHWASQFSFNISPLWVMFMFLGIWVSGFALFNWRKEDILQMEQAKNLVLFRKKKIHDQRIIAYHMASLRQEYKVGVITLVLVNALLVIINTIDIQFLWLNFDYEKAGDLTAMVHEGTYLLILSIVLAMGILLYFFRKNLNFFPDNQRLKKLAYAWIGQNVILVISVALRTWYYIDAQGLAYKRIGVLIFLCLTLFGLYTMYRKISQLRTIFYLWKTNSWAAYVMMILMTLVNWDRMIVSYNYTQHNSTSGFVLNRSVRTLDLIDQYLEKLPPQQKQEKVIFDDGYTSRVSKEVFVNNRIKYFMADQAHYSWLSWNYGDWRTWRYLSANHQK